MDRILVNTQASLAVTFFLDDAPTDGGDVRCTVTRSDGTVVVDAEAAAIGEPGDGKFTVNVPPQADVTVLTAVWTGTFAGQQHTVTTQAEVVSGLLFALGELRDLPDIDAAAKYPLDRLRRARAWIEAIIERECRTSFVVREHVDAFSGGRPAIALRPYARAVRAVAVAGVALAGADLAGVLLDAAGGMLYRSAAKGPWPVGVDNVVVRYTAGYSTTPPDDLREAALQAARWKLLSRSSGIPDRARSITNEFGNVNLGIAGRDHPTGLDEVDAVIVAWRDQVRVPSVG